MLGSGPKRDTIRQASKGPPLFSAGKSARPPTHPTPAPAPLPTPQPMPHTPRQGAQPAGSAGSSGPGRQIMAPRRSQLHAIQTRLACGRSTTFSRGAHCTHGRATRTGSFAILKIPSFVQIPNSIPPLHAGSEISFICPLALDPEQQSFGAALTLGTSGGLTTSAASHSFYLTFLPISPGPRHPTIFLGKVKFRRKKHLPIACGADSGFRLHLQAGKAGMPDSGARTSAQVA